MNERIATLEELHQACWRELQQCARDGRHEWRVMALATVAANGDGQPPEAEARSVVIRDVLAADRTLVFYTDSRSHKAAQMQAHPRATLLAWSRTLSWQLRLRVELEMLTSGLEVSSRWAIMKMRPGAQDYLSPMPPGSVLGTQAPPPPERATREYFGVVKARVQQIDWTELHTEGHRRACFDDSGARWLQP